MLTLPTAGIFSASTTAAPLLDDHDEQIAVASNTSRTISLSGVSGDTFIIAGMMNGENFDINTTSGYTVIFDNVQQTSRSNMRFKLMYKQLTGSESNPAVTIGTATDRWGAWGIKLTGAGTLDASNSALSGTDDASPSSPGLTTTVDNCFILDMVFGRDCTIASANANYPSECTGIWANAFGSIIDGCFASAYRTQGTAGSVAAVAFDDPSDCFSDATNFLIRATVAFPPA